MAKPQEAFHSRIAQIAASAVSSRQFKKADTPADDPDCDDDEDDDEDDPKQKKAKPKKADDDDATAKAIIAAGKVRRAEVDGGFISVNIPQPTKGVVADPKALARQIAAAGAKRRGEPT